MALATAAPEMLPAPAPSEQPNAITFSDGLGDRFVAAENVSGAPVQVLRLRATMTEAPAFEFALRERTARLSSFRSDVHARALRIHRMRAAERELALVSEHVEGIRLSALLRVAEDHRVPVDLSTALAVTRQLLQATSLLHAFAPDIVNGLLAPERLIVTPRASVVITEQVLCGAVEQLKYDPDRLWRDLRIAATAQGDTVRLTPRTDVMSIGLVTLALVLGRPLRDSEFPQGLPSLLDGARERSALGYERPLSAPLRDWLTRALHLESSRGFATVPDAARTFEQMVEADPLYLSLPIALERFLYSCTAALIQPRQAARPVIPMPPAVAAAPALAVPALVPPPPSAAEEPTVPAFVEPSAVAVQSTAPQPPIVLSPVPAATHEAPAPQEPDLQAHMLPPPMVAGEVPQMEVPTGGGIDWSALSSATGTVVTASDLTDLLAGADADHPGMGDASGERQPAALTSDATPAPALEPEPLPVLVTDRTPPPPPVASEVHPLEESWPLPEMPVRRSWNWRYAAAAAGLVAVLGGGIVTQKWLRPPVVAAPATGTLVVQTSPEGLPVFVDGTEKGRTPARLVLSAGSHVLEVRSDSGSKFVPLTMTGGAEISHFIEMTPDLPAATTAALPAAAGAGVSTAPAALVPRSAAVAPGSDATTPAQTWGWLEVKSPSAFEMHSGGRVLGQTGGERVRLGAGRHDVEFVNAATGQKIMRHVEVVPGKVTQLTLPATADGLVNLNASPWAEVWIGNRRIGETPLANVKVPLGRHEVLFRHPELGEKREIIMVTAAAPVRLSVEMR